jgi:hypothetical protein
MQQKGQGALSTPEKGGGASNRTKTAKVDG